ncbi:hypothetical protein P885DRAFT_27772 [Corynascus similis CBS 632.67]
MERQHNLDPSGDVILTLLNPGSPFADRATEEPSDIQMRVSSRHLILASRYFKTALNGPWSQTSLAGCSRSVYANDWDPEAFLILMSIIHGRNQQVPRVISLELLAKIAVLVDYYDCHEAVEVFAEIWLRELRSQLPAQVGRELVLWLCASWIFGYAKIFTSITTTALQQSQEPLPTLGLPITEIIEAIDRRRQQVVDKILTVLHELLETFYDPLTICSFECDSIQLGALVKEMRAKRLDPKPEWPLLGHSISATMDAARSIRSPNWACPRRTSLFTRPCDLGSLIRSKMDGLEELMGGLAIDDFHGRRSLG